MCCMNNINLNRMISFNAAVVMHRVITKAYRLQSSIYVTFINYKPLYIYNTNSPINLCPKEGKFETKCNCNYDSVLFSTMRSGQNQLPVTFWLSEM